MLWPCLHETGGQLQSERATRPCHLCAATRSVTMEARYQLRAAGTALTRPATPRGTQTHLYCLAPRRRFRSRRRLAASAQHAPKPSDSPLRDPRLVQAESATATESRGLPTSRSRPGCLGGQRERGRGAWGRWESGARRVMMAACC